MAKKLVVGVNGYGAPADPVNDPNLGRYLGFIANKCNDWLDRPVELHLLGGNTNRQSLTEARSMEMWFEAHGLPGNVRIVRHDHTTDLRGNCIALRNDTWADDDIIYFCEESRRFVTRYLVRRYLGPKAKVCDLGFDPASLRLSHRLMQRFPKLWMEWAAETLGGPFEWLRRKLRARHIRKHRQLAGEDS